MKIYKICENKTCPQNDKPTVYPDDINYCTVCGGKLIHVCKKCKTILASDSKTLCELCKARQDDGVAKAVKAVGGAALGVVTIAKATFIKK